MKNLRPPYWSHGQFIAPQHFQYQDLYHQSTQHFHWQVRQPNGWGVCRLDVRDEGLAAGVFEILRLEMIARTGEVLAGGTEHSGANARIDPRSFGPQLDPTLPGYGVYLALPQIFLDRPNVETGTAESKGATRARFALRPTSLGDLYNTEEQPLETDAVEYNLAVVFQWDPAFDEIKRVVDLVKIADLVPIRDQPGARLSPKYTPPCLTAGADPVLTGQLKAARDLIYGKAIEFAAIKRQRGVRATATGVQDAIRLQMMQTLNRFVPVFQQHVETGTVHPEELYRLLRQAVGEFSTFSEDVGALGATRTGEMAGKDLPPYDHEDIWFCISQAMLRLRELIRVMTLGAEAGIRLVYDGRYYRADLPTEFFEGERTRYYLMIDSLVRGDELWARLQKTGKIISMEGMPRIQQSALFGLKIDPLPVAPEELPQRGANHSYFIVDPTHPVWRMIRDGQNIAMFCDLDPDETVIKIYVVRDE